MPEMGVTDGALIQIAAQGRQQVRGWGHLAHTGWGDRPLYSGFKACFLFLLVWLARTFGAFRCMVTVATYSSKCKWLHKHV